jgi:hypothetical protein
VTHSKNVKEHTCLESYYVPFFNGIKGKNSKKGKFQGFQDLCKQSSQMKLNGLTLSIINNEENMQNAVMNNPVATYISIPPSMFLLNYKEGIYTDESCINDASNARAHGGI